MCFICGKKAGPVNQFQLKEPKAGRPRVGTTPFGFESAAARISCKRGGNETKEFCEKLGIGGIGGAAALPVPAEDDSDGEHLADVARIYRLQAAFHLAKSKPDIDLMMSLWDAEASLTIAGNPNSPYVGFYRIKALLLTTGSFTHHRFSLVPSFKIVIRVHGDEAFFYEECHDVANFDQSTRSIASDTFLAGMLRKVRGKWLFWQMSGGSSSPLPVDHYYFP